MQYRWVGRALNAHYDREQVADARRYAVGRVMFDYTKSGSVSIAAGQSITNRELKVAAKRLTAASGDVPIPGPGELNTWEIVEEQLSYSAAVSMGLPVVKISATLDRQVLVRDVSRFKRLSVPSGTRDYGVGVRLVVTISAAKIDGEVNLPVAAAKAELGMLNAQARMSVIGFTDSKVGKLLPEFGELRVGSFGKYTTAADRVRDYIADHEEHITPDLLRSTEPLPDQDRLTPTIATARAIAAIANRRSLQDAISGLAGRPEFAREVKEAYATFIPGLAIDARPSDAKAREAQAWSSLLW